MQLVINAPHHHHHHQREELSRRTREERANGVRLFLMRTVKKNCCSVDNPRLLFSRLHKCRDSSCGLCGAESDLRAEGVLSSHGVASGSGIVRLDGPELQSFSQCSHRCKSCWERISWETVSGQSAVVGGKIGIKVSAENTYIWRGPNSYLCEAYIFKINSLLY